MNIKNKNKKHFTLFLCVIMICQILTGCGDSENTNVSMTNENIDTESSTTYEDNQQNGNDKNIVEHYNDYSNLIVGMDMSMVTSLENSGVVYKDMDGNQKDVFQIISEAGINHVRVRVWNNPYDASGNGYGGGNTDIKNAIALSKRASKYGIKMVIDFHYSDFWADVNKQQCPKEWENKNISEKESAIYQYTYDSLKRLLDEDIEISMVQIGNEIDSGIAGEYEEANAMKLLAAASKAVRDVDRDFNTNINNDNCDANEAIKIAVHYGSSDDGAIKYHADVLDKYNIDYDVFGISFYTFWGNTIEKAKGCLDYVKETYQKETCILETSWPYTSEDGDGYVNSFSDASNGDNEISVEGQKEYILSVLDAAIDVDALGVFYWGGEWVPVGSNPDENREIWETYGSGWASSYAAEYDSEDAGKYYGGSGWDNQALFDFEGKALESLYFLK